MQGDLPLTSVLTPRECYLTYSFSADLSSLQTHVDLYRGNVDERVQTF